MLFIVLLRATVLVIAGYFVLFAASKADERIKIFGKYLALWTFVFAALLTIGSLTASSFGGRPFGLPMMGGRMVPPPMAWMHREGPGFVPRPGTWRERAGQDQPPTAPPPQAPTPGSAN